MMAGTATYSAVPHDVEAWQVGHGHDELSALLEWCHGWSYDGGVAIPCPNGVLYAQPFDYVMRLDDGRFAVVPSDTFVRWFSTDDDVSTYRVVAGSKPCAFCDVSVALYERLDDRNEPTGDFHYAEMDSAGREHTPARCVEAREAA